MTDTKQPEALRLADAYAEASFDQGLHQRADDPAPEQKRALLEAELRRQHTLIEALVNGNAAKADIIDVLGETASRQHTLIAEMLEALKLADAMLSGAKMHPEAVEKKVHAAIAKAQGEQS